MSQTNPSNMRKENLLVKSVFLTIAIICGIGINWKKNRLSIHRRGNYNLVTLNETLLLVWLLSMDNILFTCLVLYRESNDDQTLTFTLELLRIILIENIFFKLMVPVYLILQSRTHYKTLWAESRERKLTFSMTQPSFLPRPVVSKYQTNNQLPFMETTSTSKDRHRYVFITIHSGVEEPLPPVSS